MTKQQKNLARYLIRALCSMSRLLAAILTSSDFGELFLPAVFTSKLGLFKNRKKDSLHIYAVKNQDPTENFRVNKVLIKSNAGQITLITDFTQLSKQNL